MGISVWITNQDTGEVIEKTGITCPVSRAYCSNEGLLDSVKLLKYVDDYGGTCFNGYQFDDLRKDCEIIKSHEIQKSDRHSKEIIDEMNKLISVIDKRKDDIHIFIRFLGD